MPVSRKPRAGPRRRRGAGRSEPSSSRAGNPSGTDRAEAACPKGAPPRTGTRMLSAKRAMIPVPVNRPSRLAPPGELPEHDCAHAPQGAGLGELDEHPVDGVAALPGVLQQQDAARRARREGRADERLKRLQVPADERRRDGARAPGGGVEGPEPEREAGGAPGDHPSKLGEGGLRQSPAAEAGQGRGVQGGPTPMLVEEHVKRGDVAESDEELAPVRSRPGGEPGEQALAPVPAAHAPHHRRVGSPQRSVEHAVPGRVGGGDDPRACEEPAGDPRAEPPILQHRGAGFQHLARARGRGGDDVDHVARPGAREAHAETRSRLSPRRSPRSAPAPGAVRRGSRIRPCGSPPRTPGAARG